MLADHKEFIDSLSYRQLLRLWRFGDSTNPLFQGTTGAYYQQRLLKERERVGIAEHVKASKEIGFGVGASLGLVNEPSYPEGEELW